MKSRAPMPPKCSVYAGFGQIRYRLRDQLGRYRTIREVIGRYGKIEEDTVNCIDPNLPFLPQIQWIREVLVPSAVFLLHPS